MDDETRTACPVCMNTGRCIVCDGKGTYTDRFVEMRGSEPSMKKELVTEEMECEFCSATGKCSCCGGKGYCEPALSERLKEFYREKRKHLLEVKEFRGKIWDLDKFKEEHEHERRFRKN